MAETSTRRLELWTRGLVAGLTALSLLIIWTVFVTSTLGERKKAEAVQGERLQRSAGAFATGLGHLLGDSRLALDLLTRQVAAHPEVDALRSVEFRSLVQGVRERSQDLIDLRGVGLHGNRLELTGPPLEPPVSVADRDYYRLQVPFPGVGFHIDPPVVSRVTGVWTLVLSQAVPPHRGDLAVLYVALEFPRLDALVEALSDSPAEEVSVYRNDGTLLYRHPLPQPFVPAPRGPILGEILTTGKPSGLLGGTDLRAFRQVEDAPVWVVVARPRATIADDWERGFWVQAAWVSLLTAVIVGSTAVLLVLMGRLRAIRLVQEGLAQTDPLTGLLNRRAFLERCEFETARVRRNPQALTLGLIDLDHFKQVNDRYGHSEGDRVLKALAAVLTGALRTTDAVARVGGEEFAFLLPGPEIAGGLETAERIRAAVETISLPHGPQTASLGLALWDGVETFEAWYHRADQALYRAKTRGRNRVEA